MCLTVSTNTSPAHGIREGRDAVVLTVQSTLTVRDLKSVPDIRTWGSDFQPLGSPPGPAMDVPSTYAACRKGEGGSARESGV